MILRYWDSCCFLAWLQEEDPVRARGCGQVISEAEAGKLRIVTSSLTLAEVLWIRGSRLEQRCQAQGRNPRRDSTPLVQGRLAMHNSNQRPAKAGLSCAHPRRQAYLPAQPLAPIAARAELRP